MTGSTGKSFASNVIATAVAYTALPIAAFAASPILAQNLGVEGRGAVSAAIAPLLLATAVGTIGLPEAVNYFVARVPAFARAIVRRAELILLVSGALATLIGVTLAPVFSDGDSALLKLIVISMLATVPTLLIGALRGAAQGVHAWGRVNAERYVTAFSRLLSLVALALSGYLTPFSAVLVMVASPILGAVAYIGLRHGKQAARKPVQMPALLRYGSAVWVGSLSGILLVRLDQALMTPLSGLYELGLYAVAVNIAEVVPIINQAVRDVIFSADARSRDDEKLGQASRLSTLACLVVALTIAATLPIWLPLIFGQDFLAALPATYVLILSTVMGVPGSIAGAALSSRGRPGLRSLSLAVGVVVSVGVLLLLAPPLGALGAAASTLAANVITVALNLYFCSKYLNIRSTAFFGLRRRDLALARSAIRVMTRKQAS